MTSSLVTILGALRSKKQYADFVHNAENSNRRTFSLHSGKVRCILYGRVKSRGIYALLKTHIDAAAGSGNGAPIPLRERTATAKHALKRDVAALRCRELPRSMSDFKPGEQNRFREPPLTQAFPASFIGMFYLCPAECARLFKGAGRQHPAAV